MDAHPPFRSLLEHKAYLRSWLPTVCSHDVFLLGDILRDCWLFFEFVPAAQEVIESRRSHCFFTMSSSNRWTRTSAAETRAKASSTNRRQVHSMIMMKDTVRHQGDTLRGSPRKSHLRVREHQQHYQRMKVTDMRQTGFKLTREWGRNANEICTPSWDQTTCQGLQDIRCLWMSFPGSSIGAQHIENLTHLSNV